MLFLPAACFFARDEALVDLPFDELRLVEPLRAVLDLRVDVLRLVVECFAVDFLPLELERFAVDLRPLELERFAVDLRPLELERFAVDLRPLALDRFAVDLRPLVLDFFVPDEDLRVEVDFFLPVAEPDLLPLDFVALDDLLADLRRPVPVPFAFRVFAALRAELLRADFFALEDFLVPEPPFFMPPPVCLFTVAHARRSASPSPTPLSS